MATVKDEPKIELTPSLLAQLKAELKAEIAAEAAQAQISGPKETEEELLQRRRGEEKVTVQLFRDGKDYKDDVFVAVNGENCVIKRGVPVVIKRKFAEVLDASQRQDVAAAEYAEEQARQYSDAVKRFNI